MSQNLYDYLDGEAGAFRRQAIARHLDACPACSAGYTFEVQVRQMLWEKCRDDPPAGLRERILGALEAAAQPSGLAAAPDAADFGGRGEGPGTVVPE